MIKGAIQVNRRVLDTSSDQSELGHVDHFPFHRELDVIHEIILITLYYNLPTYRSFLLKYTKYV